MNQAKDPWKAVYYKASGMATRRKEIALTAGVTTNNGDRGPALTVAKINAEHMRPMERIDIADRMVADHNALVGIENPGDAIKIVKSALECQCVECGCFGSDCYTPDSTCKTGRAFAALGETGGAL